ncbi:MAG: phosphotransferase, partial [Pseudoxanthomonas sp.]|nr:phosphotransferase [Pseudoxanthomonas sp.]
MSADPVLDRAAILALIPHQGAMCLWDEVVSWDAQRIRLRARNHTDPMHPLRARGRLHALALCE